MLRFKESADRFDDYSLYFDRLSRRLSREGRKKKKKKEIPVKMKQRPVCEIGNEGRAKGRKKVKKKKKKKKGEKKSEPDDNRLVKAG